MRERQKGSREGEGAHACSREQACARAPYISKRVLLNGMQVFGV
jgi:hypothetical protein